MLSCRTIVPTRFSAHVGAMNPDLRHAITRIDAEILSQVAARGPDKTICPSEVARALDPEWQKLSSAVRRAAIRLAEAGQIDILRKGKRVEPAGVKGVIRLRIAAPKTCPMRGTIHNSVPRGSVLRNWSRAIG